MKIYSIRLSEDGLCAEVYTNVKALFEGIKRTGYEPEVIWGKPDVKYNYANLVKAIKRYRYPIVTIMCKNGYEISIEGHIIVSH